jgi:hypothetical protein
MSTTSIDEVFEIYLNSKYDRLSTDSSSDWTTEFQNITLSNSSQYGIALQSCQIPNVAPQFHETETNFIISDDIGDNSYTYDNTKIFNTVESLLSYVTTLVNLEGIVTAKVSSRAMALPIHYFNLFSINVKDPELFIHDGNPKQYQFMNSFECKKVNARKDPDEIYNTDYVDSFHSNIKRYFFKHAGFELKYIQHYLNFFVYRYNYLSKHKPKNISQQLDVKNLMIKDLFNRVKKTSKIITYSNYLKDRGITDILESR